MSLALKRRPRSASGFTLVELTIYSFLMLLITGAVMAVYLNSQRLFLEVESSYFLSSEMMSAYRVLQRDLRETTLTSTNISENSFSFLCARDAEKPNVFQISSYGTPHWQSAVYYTLEPGNQDSHHLVRSVTPLDQPQLLPVPAPEMVDTKIKRVVMRNLLSPGYIVKQGPEGYELQAESGAVGGCSLRYVVRDPDGNPQTSMTHPSETDGKFTTGMLQLDLKVVEPTKSHKVSFIEYSLRVTPRH
jgi:hypothetical protein